MRTGGSTRWGPGALAVLSLALLGAAPDEGGADDLGALNLLTDTGFAAVPHPAVMPAGEWELTSQAQVVTAVDAPFRDKAPLLLLGALATSASVTSSLCVGPDGAGATALFQTPRTVCEGGTSTIRDGEVTIRQQCRAKGIPAAMTVEGRFSADRLVAFTEVKTPLPSSGFVLLQSSAFGKRVGDCDPDTFAADKLERFGLVPTDEDPLP